MLRRKLRVGILGCGKVAQVRHIPEYAANKNAELVGFYDLVYERAESMAAQYGGRAFATAKELIECPEIDAVSICTANNAHAEMTVAALKAGKHVLCEKPMATALEECESMVFESERSGKKLMVAHNQRFMQEHVKAKQLLDAGAIGKVLTFRTCFGHGGPDAWSVDSGTANWFFDKRRSAFGAVADLGIHKTDLVRFLLGSEVAEVKALTATLDKTYADGSFVDVEDNAVCLYKMENGVVGTVTASWTYYGEEDNSTVLYGTEGIMKLCDGAHSVEICKRDGEKQVFDMPKQTNSGVIDAFVNAVTRAIASMKVIFKLLDTENKQRSNL